MTREPSLSHWARERERGSSSLLRAMVWVALSLSQVFAEALLVPITAWFLATSPASRAASRDYLGRALGRPVRMTDIARHFFEFARVILDRVFFLAGRAGDFHTELEGLEHLNAHIEAGRGCILLGAHLGSFDAMRTVARGSPVQVRPAMYRVNAGALTAIMERLDPQLAAQIIDIGKPEAMLQVRESLDRGDFVAFLADRATDPRRLIAMPFFGAPALFPTGPFQIAAMLRSPVVMFLGIRTGRRRYLLRFEPLPSAGPLADPIRPAGQAEALRQTMSGYVSRLEAACRAYPFQWFNFYHFWRQVAPNGSTGGKEPRRALLTAMLGATVFVPRGPVQAADDPSRLLNTLMRMLAEKTARQTAFHEEKTIPNLTKPLVSSGVLVYRYPDHLEKRTTSPIREDLVVEGRRASMTGGGADTHVVDIDAHAELRVVIDTLLGVLSGNLTMLRLDFDVTVEGDAANWRIDLLPRGKDAPRFLRNASITGHQSAIREIRLLLPHGYWDVLTLSGE
ncbi:MAG: hypothetical protein EXR07_11045 [Acetobacteraceae bacterium]|nr:hypothetical protein [Acetobacteraceae bacterium]